MVLNFLTKIGGVMMRRESDFSCPECGGVIIGDGCTTVEHCENLDIAEEEGYEPDSGPIYCRGIVNCKLCGSQFIPDDLEEFSGSQVIRYFDNDQELCDECSKEIFNILHETYNGCTQS